MNNKKETKTRKSKEIINPNLGNMSEAFGRIILFFCVLCAPTEPLKPHVSQGLPLACQYRN